MFKTSSGVKNLTPLHGLIN